MATEDRLGLLLSTASPAAAAHYQQGIDFLLAFRQGAALALDEAIASDENFALALAARARLSLLLSEPHKAKQMINRARDAVSVEGTDRERSHVEVLRLGIEGTPAQTLDLALSHIAQWPRDALIMSLPLGGIGLFASSGMPNHDQARVDLCELYAGNYDDDWWFESHRGAHGERKCCSWPQADRAGPSAEARERHRGACSRSCVLRIRCNFRGGFFHC